MLIKSRNDKDEVSITLNGHTVESTNDIKQLGVNIDEHLVFSKHISDMCVKASQRIGVLGRLRNLIPTEAKLLLYKTYCHVIWHFCKASDSRKIERVQERGLRIVFNTCSEDYHTLLKRAKLPSLYNRRLQDIAILMYKVKHGLLRKCVTDPFSIKNSIYCLRNRNFSIPTYNTVQYGKHSLRYLGPHIWSKLDKADKERPTLQS